MRTRAYLEAMARHGTTTVEVKTGCGLDAGAEAKLLRMLWALRRDPLDLIPSFLLRLPREPEGGLAHAIEWVVTELLPKIHRRGVARFADLVWDCDPDLLPCFDRYLETARRIGFECKIHADGANPRRRHFSRGTAPCGDHRSSGARYRMSKPADCRSRYHRHAPAQRGFGGDNYDAPARALIDAGVAIALGSNFNPHHTQTLNMQAVVALACGRLA